jgi:hypothetical protein
MHYKIEVLIKTVDSSGAIVETWQAKRPSNGPPYVFETLKEAESIFEMCYPRGSKARVEGVSRIVKYEN